MVNWNRLHSTPGLIVCALFLVISFGAATQARAEQIDRIVAVVNNDIIVRSELDQYMRQLVKRLKIQKVKIPPQKDLEKQALDRLILIKLQLQVAKHRGIRINDEQVNQALVSIARKNKMSLIQFRRRLSKAGLDFAEYREQLRQQIILGRLQQKQVSRRIRISKQEIESFLADKNNIKFPRTAYKIQHILIATREGATSSSVQKARKKAQHVLGLLNKGGSFSDLAVRYSAGQRAFRGGVMGWFKTGTLPRFFVAPLVKLNKGQHSGLIRSPAGFHIIKLLDIKGGQRRIVQQVRARHILLKTNAILTDEIAQKRLRRLKERVLSGESFGQICKAHSEDTFTAKKGGDLGWRGPSNIPPVMWKALSKMQRIGEISDPVKTNVGWHLIQLIDRRKQDDADGIKREMAIRMLRNRKRRERLNNWLRRLRDESFVEIKIDG